MGAFPRVIQDPDLTSPARRALLGARREDTPRREIVARAQRSEVLARLPKRALKRLLLAADAVHVTRGITLGRECRLVDQVVIIADGAAELTRDGRVVATLGPGDVYGLTEALAHRETDHSLRTTAPSEVLVLRPQAVTALLDRRAASAIGSPATAG